MKKSTEIIMNNLMAFFVTTAASGLFAYVMEKKMLGFALLYGGMGGFLILALVLLLLEMRE